MYLSIGMTADEYWNGDPRLVIPYREADRLKWNRFNTEAWLQGRYIYAAVSLSLHNAFSKSQKDYPNKPENIMEKTEEEKQTEEIREQERVMEQLKRMVAAQQRNKQHG